jgi:hypothetical protein
MSSNIPRKKLGNLESAKVAFAAANDLQIRRMAEGNSADFCYRQYVETEWDLLVSPTGDVGEATTTSSSSYEPHI